DLAELEAMHARLRALLAERGAELAGLEFCPHGPDDGCSCRKPLPGMIERLLEGLGVQADDALVVGDSLRDIEAAHAAGVPAVLVRTGKGERTLASGRLPAGVPVHDDLASLADALLGGGERS
ncbi:MAG: HAD-IIIA family hydrolase, partial [Gammaproteobacteria bacterium]